MIRRALVFLKGMWGKLVGANLLMILGGAASMSVPLAVGELFEENSLWQRQVLFLLCILIVGTICSGWKNRLIGGIGNRIAVRMRMALMSKVLSLPKSYFDAHSTGELLSTIGNDVNRFRDALSGGMTYILEIVLSLIVAVTIMLAIEPILTLVLLGSSLLILWVNARLTRKTSADAKGAQKKLAEINALAAQGIGGAQTLRAFNLQKLGMGMFWDANRQWEASEGRIICTKSRVNIATGVLGAVQLVSIIGLGLYFVSAERMGMGELLSFVLYAQGISGPMTSASSLMVDIRAALGSMNRVFEVLDVEVGRPGELRPAKPAVGNIRLQDVDFSYVDENGRERKVLQHLNLEIPAGKMAALVGESGSGKTTLMNLIAGFLEPDRGQVTIDGNPVLSLAPEYLRSSVSIISQNPFLFEMSVSDNIASGNPEASEEEIIHAAKMAGAHDFIEALPDGYDTILGENGMTLSGGQRQRIAIARAFLRNAPILLMDEATSALDNRTEREVQRAVARLGEDKTILVIAHRLTTIRNADKICYLSNGSILKEGTHEQMMVDCAEYRELYNEQAIREMPEA